MAKFTPSLGFGLLFASFIGMIGRAGAISDQFFFSACGGVVLAGVAAFTVGIFGTRQPNARHQRFAVLAATALGFGSALAGSLIRCLAANAGPGAETLEGVLFGAGCCLMALAWTAVFASYRFVEALQQGAAALFLGVLLQAAAQLMDALFPAPLWCPAYLGFSLLCSLFELSVRDGKAEAAEEPPATATTAIRSRVGGLVKTAWAPLCGLGICAFLLGSLWMQAFPSGGGNADAFPMADGVGPLLACALIAFATRRISSYAQTKRLFWIVMPITAAIFLITPSLEGLTLPHWNLAVANLQNAGSVCMLFCSWALLLLGARTNSLPIATTFGASLALIGTLPLLGACSFTVLGNAGNVVTVVLFILYTAAVILFLAWGGADDSKATDRAAHVFGAFIESRCAKLADRGSLTPRESEILVLLGRGHGYAYIAETFYISEATARTHARNIYRKLDIASQEDLLELIDR